MPKRFTAFDIKSSLPKDQQLPLNRLTMKDHVRHCKQFKKGNYHLITKGIRIYIIGKEVVINDNRGENGVSYIIKP